MDTEHRHSWLFRHRDPAMAAADKPGVHLWLCDLDDPVLNACLREGMPSGEELRRGEQMSGDIKRWFLRGRALQRFLIGRFLNEDPRELEFELNAHGKPSLAGCRPRPCHFNTSRCGGLFALVIARGGAEVGVDIEIVRPDFAWQAAASLFLDDVDLRRFQEVPAAGRPASFLRFWTSLEAFAKAGGNGLAVPPPHACNGRAVLNRIPDLTCDSVIAPDGWHWALWIEPVANAEVVVAVTASAISSSRRDSGPWPQTP